MPNEYYDDWKLDNNEPVFCEYCDDDECEGCK